MSIYLDGKRIDAATTGDIIDANFSATSLNALQNKQIYQEVINNSNLTTDNKRLSLAINELNANKQNKVTVSTVPPAPTDVAKEGDIWIVVS